MDDYNSQKENLAIAGGSKYRTVLIRGTFGPVVSNTVTLTLS